MKGSPIIMAHTYILDTSVLLASPKAIFAFRENSVVLPLVVIKELESKRNDPELGYYARTVLRSLEELRITTGGDLREGVMVNEDGGTLRIEINHVSSSSLPDVLRNDPSHDTRILAVAAALSHEGNEVTVVSKDLPMRLLASTITGLTSEDYRGDTLPDSGYNGLMYVETGSEKLDVLYKSYSVRWSSISEEEEPPLHTGLVIKAGRQSALARMKKNGEVELVNPDLDAFGVRGRSAEQRIALANLLDENVGIVSLGGPGGTGKSMLALAAGLEAVLEKRTHNKIVVFRPLFAVGGQELGYLPGTAEEKMGPWAAAVFDALSAFASKNVIEEIIERNLIEVLPLTHIRGRTFTDTIMIIDEAQNLERNVLLTALSRTGNNTRVFISSDVAQRDNLRVGRHDGIASVVEKLKGEELFAHIMLTRSERSRVAELVTRLLDDI